MIKKIVEKANKCGGLDSHQRNLLSVAYKSLVGTRRWAWRLICHSESRQSLHAAEQADGKTDIHVMLPDCKQKLKIENELDFICKSVIVSYYECVICYILLYLSEYFGRSTDSNLFIK